MQDGTELQMTSWLAVVRRRAPLIVAVTLSFAVLGAAAAVAKSTTYTARSSVLLQNALSDQAGDQTGGAEAKTLSEVATSDVVRNRARSRGAGDAKLSATLSTDGQVVQFQARTGDAQQAADAANAYAASFVSLTAETLQRQFDAAGKSLSGQVAQLDRMLAEKGRSAGNIAALTSRRADFLAALDRLMIRGNLSSSGRAAVLAPATVPTADPRHIATFALLLGAVGLIAGLTAAGLRDGRDGAIHSLEDLRQSLERLGPGQWTPVLTPLPRVADRQRKNHDGLVPATSAEADSYTVLRATLEQHQSPWPRSLVVSAATSGGDVSELAANLATSFARAGRRTVLAPLDLRGGPAAGRTAQVCFVGIGSHPGGSRGGGELGALEPAIANRSGTSAALNGSLAGAAAGWTDASTGSRSHPIDSSAAPLDPATLELKAVPGVADLSVLVSSPLRRPVDLLVADAVESLIFTLSGVAQVTVAAAPPVPDYPDAMLVAAQVDETLLMVEQHRCTATDLAAAIQRVGQAGGRVSCLVLVSRAVGQGHLGLEGLLLPRRSSGSAGGELRDPGVVLGNSGRGST